ncbi:MAG TPA: hypothetical protein VG267_22490 [Terracidiphilus sp.]|jgi:hypothetical protein|nr:hypothetical protein [Terracidiphilus sp.]
MRRFVFFLVCFVALVIPVAVLASGGEGGFDGVVRSIERSYHVRATRIPFMGLISFVSGGATHGGVSNLHVAEFDNFSAPMDSADLTRMVEEKLGSDWQRVVRETQRGGEEQTLIYMRPEGSRMGLFVLDSDGRELDVVQVSVDPDHLNDTIQQYGHHHGSEEHPD